MTSDDPHDPPASRNLTTLTPGGVRGDWPGLTPAGPARAGPPSTATGPAGASTNN